MKTKIIGIVSLFIMSANLLTAQKNSCPGNVAMQVDNNTLTSRKKAFGDKKLKILSLYAQKSHPLSSKDSDIKTFFAMIDEIAGQGTGMRVYIGAYSTTEDTDDGQIGSDAEYENTLVLIFVPTYEQGLLHKDVKKYYIIDPRKGSNQYIMIKETTAIDWVDNYRTNVLPLLKKTVPASVFGDTKSLWYNNADLLYWQSEMLCQNRNGSPINTIQIHWGAFDKDAAVRFSIGNNKTKLLPVKNQLTILFEVPGATILNLKQRKAFLNEERKKLNSHYFDATYDTGVPCPPGDNCGDLGIGKNVLKGNVKKN